MKILVSINALEFIVRWLSAILIQSQTVFFFTEDSAFLLVQDRAIKPTSPVMMTSSNGNISALLALCEGNPPVTGGFPSQRPVTRSLDVFYDLRLKKKPIEQRIEKPVIWEAIALIMTSP